MPEGRPLFQAWPNLPESDRWSWQASSALLPVFLFSVQSHTALTPFTLPSSTSGWMVSVACGLAQFIWLSAKSAHAPQSIPLQSHTKRVSTLSDWSSLALLVPAPSLPPPWGETLCAYQGWTRCAMHSLLVVEPLGSAISGVRSCLDRFLTWPRPNGLP